MKQFCRVFEDVILILTDSVVSRSIEQDSVGEMQQMQLWQWVSSTSASSTIKQRHIAHQYLEWEQKVKCLNMSMSQLYLLHVYSMHLR